MGFSIDMREHESGVVILELHGEITFENSDILRDKIDELCDAGKASIVIDLLGLKYMSSAGMGVLVHGLKRTRQLGGKLSLLNLNSKMRRVFLITQFTHHFDVFENIDKAISSFTKEIEGD